jgi:hypothetical protein
MSRWWVLPLLAVAAAFVACRSGEVQGTSPVPSVAAATSSFADATPSASAVPPAPSSGAPRAPDVEYSVVWGPPGSESTPPQSLLLEWRPPILTVLGNRSGAIIYAAGGLYRWQEIKGKGYGLRDCDEAWNPKENPDPGNRYVIETVGAMAKRLDAPGEVQIHEPPSFEQMSSYSNIVTLEASLGSYLFTTVFEDVSNCLGAHPFSSHRESVFDLAAKDFVTPYPTKDDEQLLLIEARQLGEAALAPCVQAAWEAQGARPEKDRVPGSLGAMSLYTALPRWSRRRGLHFELYLGAMDTYVAGEKTCGLVVKHAPPSLEKFPLPAAFAELPKKLPGFHPAGWAVIPADDEAGLDAAMRVFKVRKKKAELPP